MIVVDSSAVVAIIRAEAEANNFVAILDDTSDTAMSAVSLVETTVVMVGRRPGADVQSVTRFVRSLGIEIADVTSEHAAFAIKAFASFGKGRHRASLNLADCFSYALAKARNAPLLYKGGDFSQTDIKPAWRP